MSTIRYFLPEDGDEELHPNVYLAPKPRQPNQPPLLRDIKSSFPLPGTFHFRFKSSLLPGAELYGKGNDMSVWMDCIDDNRPVPVWKNSIIAKVTRISLDEDDLEEEDDVAATTPTQHMNGVSHTRPPPRAPPAPAAAAPPPTENLLNVFDTPAPAPAPTPTTTNLFDMDAAPSNHSSTGSLLDIPTTTPAAPSSDPHSDLLGMSMGAPAPAPTPMPPQQHYPNQYPNQYPTQPQAQSNIYHQQQQQQRAGPMNGSHHSHTMNGSGHSHAQQRGNYGGPQMNKPKENGFDSFANKQGPFGNLNWD